MAQHARLTVDAGLQVYFCDPHSPWQRATNENTKAICLRPDAGKPLQPLIWRAFHPENRFALFGMRFNGLLRQYFPKGTDLSAHGANDLAAVALALNTRPRKTLAWHTPAEALDRLISAAQTSPVATTA